MPPCQAVHVSPASVERKSPSGPDAHATGMLPPPIATESIPPASLSGRTPAPEAFHVSPPSALRERPRKAAARTIDGSPGATDARPHGRASVGTQTRVQVEPASVDR